MTTELNNQTENKKVTPANIALKWGVIGGLLSIIISLGLYYAYGGRLEKISRSLQIGADCLVILIVTFMAMKERRETIMGGYIGFGKAYGTGLLTCCIILVIVLVYGFVFFNYIVDFDQVVNGIIDETTKTMKEQGRSAEEIKTGIGYTLPYLTPNAFLIWGAVMAIFEYLIINLISAAIAKKDAPQN